MISEKTILRRSLRATRRAFVDAMDARASEAALAALAAQVSARLGAARVIAGYVAVGAEIDPLPILEAVVAAGRRVVLPAVADRETPLRFLHWRPGEPLVAGPFGLLQPAADAAELAPDLILAPLIGFDRALGRLGQGAAHYDRAFAEHPAARRIGLAWSVQETGPLPVEPWDVPLHAVATELDWIEA
jgi:5-formyltetrahydrofolate cyclo-ligase